MRGGSTGEVFSLAQRCKNILAANCQAYLNTIKADAKGSKDDIHSSKIKYLLKKGKPYLWIQEGDMHNVNTIIDERGSLSVHSPIPGPLMGLLRSINKVPARVALAGDVIRLRDEKVQVATDSLKELIFSEYKSLNEASYSVSTILNSAGSNCKFRGETFSEIIEGNANHAVYKFNIRSCSYIDGSGDIHEVELNDMDSAEADVLTPLAEKLIDGINQSQARRRALMLLCLVHFNANARDALMLSIDSKGFDVLAKVHMLSKTKSLNQYQWKELRFAFREEVPSAEAFCTLLVQMEEEALKYVKSFSGIS